MGLKKCNNEPLHGEKRHRKTEAFVLIQMVVRGEIFWGVGTAGPEKNTGCLIRGFNSYFQSATIFSC